MKTVFKTTELKVEEVIETVKHKADDNDKKTWKAILQDSKKEPSIKLTIQMEELPDELREGNHLWVDFVDKQEKLDVEELNDEGLETKD